MKYYLSKLVFFLVFSVIILSMMYCGSKAPSKNQNSTTENNYLNHSDTAHYVGMSQCKLCHQAIYNSFIQTGMGKSFDNASQQKSSAKFAKHTVIYDKYKDFYYYPFWQNDSLKILEYRLHGQDTIYKHIEKVDYIIGSGQHTNSHIYSTNGYLHQMPMTYYTQKGTWDFPPGFENGFNTRFSRKIGLECISCHNSFPEFVEGSENKFSSLPNGINCERCHGPGSIHVQQRSLGTKVDTSKYIDYSIVNPGKLPIDLQFDVCQRCHLQGNTVLKKGKSFFDFRPGLKLSDYMTTFLPRYKNADDQFIMASHADRLKQSKCFIKSFVPNQSSSTTTDKSTAALRPYKNALTCVTCHNPHISVKVTGKETFNNACENCHNPTKQNGMCNEKQSLRLASDDNCVSCHMPKSGSIDIPHVSVHDHYIRKPQKTNKQEKVKTFIGLSAINEKNPDNLIKAKAYLQQYDKFEYKTIYLDSAEYYMSKQATNDEDEQLDAIIYLYFMKQEMNKIIDYVNKVGKEKLLTKTLINKSWTNANGWTLYRIGEAYYSLGNTQDAYQFYKQADELAPFEPEFKNKLGASLMALNRTNEAIAVFESCLNEDAKFVPALNNLGYAYLITGKVLGAEKLYNRAFALDPDYKQLIMNRVGLAIYKKNYKEAENQLKEILRKTPENAQAKEVLKQVKKMEK